MSDKDEILNGTHGQDPKSKISLDAQGVRPGDDMLMDYLAGDLTPEEQHEIEQWLSDEGLESDAVEGLQLMNAGEARHSVHRINHQLRKNLHGRKDKRRKVKNDQTTIIAIGVILLLAVIAWLVIRLMK